MESNRASKIRRIVAELPKGYSEVLFEAKRFSVTKEVFNDGRSVKVFARDLSGTDFISFNLYLTGTGDQLKPCEMPVDKVVEFLTRMKMLNNE